MSAGAVIGREEELGEIRACLTDGRQGPCRPPAHRRARDRQDRSVGGGPRARARRRCARPDAPQCARPRRRSRSQACPTSSRRSTTRSQASSPPRAARRWKPRCYSATRATAGALTRTPSDSRCSMSYACWRRRRRSSSGSTTCSGSIPRPPQCCRLRCDGWTEHASASSRRRECSRRERRRGRACRGAHSPSAHSSQRRCTRFSVATWVWTSRDRSSRACTPRPAATPSSRSSWPGRARCTAPTSRCECQTVCARSSASGSTISTMMSRTSC